MANYTCENMGVFKFITKRIPFPSLQKQLSIDWHSQQGGGEPSLTDFSCSKNEELLVLPWNSGAVAEQCGGSRLPRRCGAVCLSCLKSLGSRF